MTPAGYRRARRLYRRLAALGRAAAERALRAVTDDPEVAAMVGDLLAASARMPPDFLAGAGAGRGPGRRARGRSVGTTVPVLPGQRVTRPFDPPPASPDVGSGDHPDRAEPVPAADGVHRYQVLQLLGEGGMGRVWLAYDRDLRRTVALKTVRSTDRGLVQRFLAEARVVGGLQHPAIVPVHEIGQTGDGHLFYTMPVVRGHTLREALRQLAAGKGARLSLVRRMQILAQVARAVDYAHGRGVLHSDLKPENVMLGEHGEVQVVDWGLSTQLVLQPGARRRPAAILAGTPDYMSPEQLQGHALDQRSDVFALGVMMYELLTLSLPFPADRRRRRAAGAVVPPRQRAPDADVPVALEQACLAALAEQPGQRLPGARALADRIETWLEAEADRSRRRELAADRAAEAKERLADYQRRRDDIARLEAEAAAQAKRFHGWQPLEVKHELFAAEDRIAAARAELGRVESSAVTLLTEALGFEPGHRGARAALADYYWQRFLAAEAARDEHSMRFFAGLVASYHDGRFARALSGDGTLRLHSSPAGAEVFLHRLVEQGPILVEAEARPLGRTPLGPVGLGLGSYVAVLRRRGYRDTRYPVFISRNRDWQGEVRLYRDGEIGADFLHVPAGPFLRGGDPGCQGWDLAAAEPWVTDFFLARYPVTMAEYLEFLDHVARTEGLAAARLRGFRPAPGAPTDLVEDGRGGLRLPDADPDGDAWDPSWPALGVSWLDAAEYCRWRSRRDRRPYRLPDETEWEKAARGVDGRYYPWGNRFDPCLCAMRESHRGRSQPVPVTAFPTDVSVYGVRGLAGNVMEWTSTRLVEGDGASRRETFAMRGGTWDMNRVRARAATRTMFDAVFTSHSLGFRLARTPDSRAR